MALTFRTTPSVSLGRSQLCCSTRSGVYLIILRFRWLSHSLKIWFRDLLGFLENKSEGTHRPILGEPFTRILTGFLDHGDKEMAGNCTSSTGGLVSSLECVTHGDITHVVSHCRKNVWEHLIWMMALRKWKSRACDAQSYLLIVTVVRLTAPC